MDLSPNENKFNTILNNLEKNIAEIKAMPKRDARHPTKEIVNRLLEEFKQEINSLSPHDIVQDSKLIERLSELSCPEVCFINFANANFLNGQADFALKVKFFKDRNIKIDCQGDRTYLWHEKIKFDVSGSPQRKILFVGERSFTFTLAFIQKNMNLADNIISSCYERFSFNESPHQDNFDRLKDILNAGVIVVFGVDATCLEKYNFAKSEGHFERIQFNCPYADNEKTGPFLERPETQKLVEGFFKSAPPLLHKENGRLCVSIQQPINPTYTASKWGRNDYQKSYGLTPKVAAGAGLRLEKVLLNIVKRYPGYEPYIGCSDTNLPINEFLFKRSPGISDQDLPEFFEYEGEEVPEE